MNGALKVCVPPHELETVNDPLAGGFVKVTEPVTSNVLVVILHAPGVEVTELIAQLTVQEGGAVKVEVFVQPVFALNDAVTVQFAPLEGNEVRV